MLSLQSEFNTLSEKILVRERLARQGLSELGNGVHYFKNAVLRGKDYPSKFESAMINIEQATRDYRQVAEPTAEEQALLEAIDHGIKQYRNTMVSVKDLLAKNATPTQIDGSVAGADQPLAAALEKLSKINVARGIQSQNDFNRRLGDAFTLLLGIMVSMIVSGIVTAWVIITNITRPLAVAVEIAQSVAAGNIEQPIPRRGKDEIAELLTAMASMVDTFKKFVSAQFENARQHESGQLDDQIDAGQFPGIYGQMARSINELVQSPIAMNKRVVEVVKCYAQGNLDVDMDRLPGQMREITEAIDGVKSSLQMVNHEIKRLVAAAVRGDFTIRGRADQYQYEFREMIEGLNVLMEVSDGGLAEVSRVLGALADSDLTQHIDGDYQGTFGQLRDDSNTTVARLREVVESIQEASRTVSSAAQEIAVAMRPYRGAPRNKPVAWMKFRVPWND